MILGIAGASGAGKSEVMKILEKRGFQAHSLSDEIRSEARRRNLPGNARESLIELGQEMRKSGGLDVLARRILHRLTPALNHAVDSIRHPAEAECLRQHGESFRLLWIETPKALRIQRLASRGLHGDADHLRQVDQAEHQAQTPASQQLAETKRAADHILENSGSLKDLETKVQTYLQKNLNFHRPAWDEYFMRVAHESATRSNCVKRRLAAVITMGRHIVAVGYNGTPKGMINCNQGGCPRCADFGASGENLGECLCAHAEANAIAQSALHGAATKDGTLYCTFCPCRGCAKLIIGAGIARVVYEARYSGSDEEALAMLEAAEVRTEQLQPPESP